MNRDGAQIVFFISGFGRVKQLFGFGCIFGADTEHTSTVFATPVPVGKAGAGEGLLQLRLFGGGGPAVFRQQTGVNTGDDRHVLGPFHTAFQLQTGHAHIGNGAQIVGKTVVFQTEGIFFAGPLVDAVRQAAGLGAAASIAGAAANHRAHGALAGIAHAEGTMGEDLHFHGTVAADFRRVFGRTFTGDDHPLAAVLRHFDGTAGGKDAHLCACVEGQVRQSFAQNFQQAPVLNDDGVHAEVAGCPGGFQRSGQFTVGQQGVQGQKDPHAADMTIGQSLRKLLVREVFGAPAGIKVTPAQIDGIRAVLYGGAERFR